MQYLNFSVSSLSSLKYRPCFAYSQHYKLKLGDVLLDMTAHRHKVLLEIVSKWTSDSLVICLNVTRKDITMVRIGNVSSWTAAPYCNFQPYCNINLPPLADIWALDDKHLNYHLIKALTYVKCWTALPVWLSHTRKLVHTFTQIYCQMLHKLKQNWPNTDQNHLQHDLWRSQTNNSQNKISEFIIRKWKVEKCEKLSLNLRTGCPSFVG